MRYSKMMNEVLAILRKEPDKAFTLYGIAEEMGKDETFNRKSSLRASLSRCLNRMKKEGIVDWQYTEVEHKLESKQGNRILLIPQPNEGKFWFIAHESTFQNENRKKPYFNNEVLLGS